MEPTKFNIVEPRFNKAGQIIFFVLGSLILLALVILLTIFINKRMPLQMNIRGLAIPLFCVLEYLVAAFAFATKTNGLIDLDDDLLSIETSGTSKRTLGYTELEKILLNKGRKHHFLASSRTPKIYTVVFILKTKEEIKLKIENLVKENQSMVPARIHELTEKYKIPLER